MKKQKCNKFSRMTRNRIPVGKIDRDSFENEYFKCIWNGSISDTMGIYLNCIANNIAYKYRKTNRYEIIEELHQHILIDALERFFEIPVSGSALATFSVVMSNKAKNFLRDIQNGNIDIYGTRIGYGRGARWIKKDFRKIKLVTNENIEENFGNIEEDFAYN